MWLRAAGRSVLEQLHKLGALRRLPRHFFVKVYRMRNGTEMRVVDAVLPEEPDVIPPDEVIPVQEILPEEQE